jgi:exosortase
MPSRPVLAAWGVLIVMLVWTYWNTISVMVGVWRSTEDYGHCFFVPPFAAFLLWLRQDIVKPWPKQGTLWTIPFFVAWALMRWGGAYLKYDGVDRYSLLFFLAGLTLLVGGWRAMRWAWPSIFFLLFMMPLPGFVQAWLSRPLQGMATRASEFVLQTAGVRAVAIGNVIQLSNPDAPPLEVAQACSGLRMLMLFFAICVGAAFMLRGPLWAKALVVVSAIPIALFSNVTRITLNGMLSEWINPGVGHWVHDNAGWFMMPLAMLLLWGEMGLVDKLRLEPVKEGPLALGGPGARSRGGPARRDAAKPSDHVRSPARP